MSLRLTQAAPFLFVWLWSTGFVGAKYGLPYIEPFFMLLLRFAIVVVIFYLLVLIFRAKWLDKQQIAQQLLVGTLIHGGYLGGVFFAIKQDVPAGLAAIIVGLQPIVTTLACWLFLKQQINRSQLAGLSLGFIGISLVIVEKNAIDTSSLSTLGIIACLVALACISAGTLLQKQYAEKVPLLSGSFYQYIGATLVVAILSFSMETQTVIYSWELFAAMSWLILGLSVLAILLLLYMIREGEVAKVTSYFYLVPPAAVIQTWWLFDEDLGVLALAGCVCTVLGVYLVVKKTAS
ncbi:MAG: hypothetical protein OFPI_25650 [Osedax symbiont Rs2]|nr:MAG: hypothetical protein OFPI_25650 [Osedax symbiont Rs2]